MGAGQRLTIMQLASKKVDLTEPYGLPQSRKYSLQKRTSGIHLGAPAVHMRVFGIKVGAAGREANVKRARSPLRALNPIKLNPTGQKLKRRPAFAERTDSATTPESTKSRLWTPTLRKIIAAFPAWTSPSADPASSPRNSKSSSLQPYW